MSALIPLLLVLGVLALGVSLALFFGFRFERLVGVRYLIRRRHSRVVTMGLLITAAVTALGLAALLVGHLVGRGRLRDLETLGVVLALGGGVWLLVFVLLRVFSVFTTVSTMGVVLGVASLVVVFAVTSGFEREFQDKVLGVNAHLLVMPYGEPGHDEREREAEEYMRKLKDLPGLRRMSKFSLSAGEVMIGKVGAMLKGIDLSAGADELERALLKDQGSLADFRKPARCPDGEAGDAQGDAQDQSVGHIMLGTELAHRLRTKVGQCVSVLVPFSGETLDAAPLSFKFKVIGLFRFGFNEYDTRLAFTSLEDSRKLGTRLTLFGVEMRFYDPYRALKVEPEVVARLGHEPHLMDWETLNHNLFMALQMQKLIIALILAIIVVVAAFNILASLTMIVLSKVREIAILGAMGARTRTLLRVFMVGGALVGFVGVGLGVGYGLAVCGLARIYGYALDPKVYLIGQLPVHVSARELLLVAGGAQLLCMLATLYPAWRASRMRILDGLRFG